MTTRIRSFLVGPRAGRPFWLVAGTAVLVALMSLSHATVAQATPKQSSHKASVLSEQAVKFSLAGKHALALELFKQAYQLDPYLGYLYSAARAAHKAEMYEEARRDYRRVIEQAKPDDPFRLKASHHLKTLRDEKKVASSTMPVDANKDAPPAESTSKPVSKVVPISVMAGGGTLLGVGLILQVMASSGQSELDAKKTSQGKFDPRLITLAAARDEQDSINSKVTAGWALAGLGAAALATGGWLYWRVKSQERVAVWPSISDRAFAVNVRF